MDISSISDLSKLATYGLNKTGNNVESNVEAFDSLLKSAMNMVNETNNLTKEAQEAALNFAMGNSDSTHDLAIAQNKALTAIQYTVTVRNAVIDAYKEIMQIQF